MYVDSTRARDLYFKYAAAVAYVAVETPAGDQHVGTAFHIGSNIWLTAKHVVQGNRVVEIATTRKSIPDYSETVTATRGVLGGDLFSLPGTYSLARDPMLHPDDDVDVAVLELEGPSFHGQLWGDRSRPIPVVQLGGWLDDWLGDELILEPVLVMGYPPIPFGREPLLVAATAEINTVLDKRNERHPYFILSATARGGFSGSVALTTFENALGVTTESLVMDDHPVETGYFAVLAVEPIYNCLDHHGVMPPDQKFIEEFDAWEASDFPHVEDPKRERPSRGNAGEH